MTYREHPSKVVRLAEGQLVGYPPAEEEDCTLWVALADAPDEWEGILGKRHSSDTAELVGIPVFAYDLHLGDLVSVVPSDEGGPVVSGIVADRGNFTFRVWFEREPHAAEHWRRLMEDLEPFGCWFDTWSETLVAISAAPPNSHAVADYLAGREANGEFRYETGRTS